MGTPTSREAVVATRPRHQRRELEDVLRDLEAKGWRVVKGRKYFKAYCPCPMQHLKTVHLTPSNSNYQKNLLGELRRATCWEGTHG